MLSVSDRLLGNGTGAAAELSCTLLHRAYFRIILSCNQWKDHWSQRICSPCSWEDTFCHVSFFNVEQLLLASMFVFSSHVKSAKCLFFSHDVITAAQLPTPVFVRFRKYTGQKEKTKVTTRRQIMAVAFSILCPAATFSCWPLFWDNTMGIGRFASSYWAQLIKAVLKICSRTTQLD